MILLKSKCFLFSHASLQPITQVGNAHLLRGFASNVDFEKQMDMKSLSVISCKSNAKNNLRRNGNKDETFRSPNCAISEFLVD